MLFAKILPGKKKAGREKGRSVLASAVSHCLASNTHAKESTKKPTTQKKKKLNKKLIIGGSKCRVKYFILLVQIGSQEKAEKIKLTHYFLSDLFI